MSRIVKEMKETLRNIKKALGIDSEKIVIQEAPFEPDSFTREEARAAVKKVIKDMRKRKK